MPDNRKATNTEKIYREESTTRSLNVTSASLPSMPAVTMDMNVQYAVLPARTVKLLARMVQKSLETAGYIHVTRKPQMRPDPNSCKIT